MGNEVIMSKALWVEVEDCSSSKTRIQALESSAVSSKVNREQGDQGVGEFELELWMLAVLHQALDVCLTSLQHFSHAMIQKQREVCMSVGCFLCGPCLVNSSCHDLSILLDQSPRHKDVANLPGSPSLPPTHSSLSPPGRSQGQLHYFFSQGLLPSMPDAQCLKIVSCVCLFCCDVILLCILQNGKLGATQTQTRKQDL